MQVQALIKNIKRNHEISEKPGIKLTHV